MHQILDKENKVNQLPVNVLDRVIDAYDTLEEGNGRSWLSSIMAYYGRPVSPYYTGLNGVEYRERKEKENNQIFNNGLVAIYPNPSTGSFVVDCSDIASLNIYDISGVRIMQKALDKGKNEINLSDHHKGVFIAKITCLNSISVHKIVVE